MTEKSKNNTARSISSADLALAAARAAIDKKGTYSIVYDVGKRGSFTDYFLLTSGSNPRQVQAIADEIYKQFKETTGVLPKLEGYDEGRWVLVDVGSVVAHVFLQEVREFYDLETLWADAPRLKIPAEYYQSSTAATLN